MILWTVRALPIQRGFQSSAEASWVALEELAEVPNRFPSDLAPPMLPNSLEQNHA